MLRVRQHSPDMLHREACSDVVLSTELCSIALSKSNCKAHINACCAAHVLLTALLCAWLPRRRKLGGGRSSEQNSSVDDVTALEDPDSEVEDSQSGSGSDSDYEEEDTDSNPESPPLPEGAPAAIGVPSNWSDACGWAALQQRVFH